MKLTKMGEIEKKLYNYQGKNQTQNNQTTLLTKRQRYPSRVGPDSIVDSVSLNDQVQKKLKKSVNLTLKWVLPDSQSLKQSITYVLNVMEKSSSIPNLNSKQFNANSFIADKQSQEIVSVLSFLSKSSVCVEQVFGDGSQNQIIKISTDKETLEKLQYHINISQTNFPGSLGNTTQDKNNKKVLFSQLQIVQSQFQQQPKPLGHHGHHLLAPSQNLMKQGEVSTVLNGQNNMHSTYLEASTNFNQMQTDEFEGVDEEIQVQDEEGGEEWLLEYNYGQQIQDCQLNNIQLQVQEQYNYE